MAIACIFGLVALLRALPLSGATLVDLGGAGMFVALAVAFGWVELVRRQRTIEIDVSRNQIAVRTVSWPLRRKVALYPANAFSSVVSYITALDRFPVNRVELVTHAGAESLLLASFSPWSSATSFFSIPKDGEAPAAEALRNAVSVACGYVDGGFLGHRLPSRQSRPDRLLDTRSDASRSGTPVA